MYCPGSTPKSDDTKPKNGTSDPKAPNNSTATPSVEKKCSNVRTAISSIRGIGQNCTVHDDCMGASCNTEILGHPLFYNFSVMPCEKPSVQLKFRIADINGSEVSQNFLKSETVVVPKGNMSYTGMAETESKIVVTLDKTQEVTHFRSPVVLLPLPFKTHLFVSVGFWCRLSSSKGGSSQVLVLPYPRPYAVPSVQ
eukprot:sb/3470890/